MGVQLAFENEIILLNDQITYNFQTASVGDLSLSRSNYTSTFNIPRTLENQRFFAGLGIPSDQSDVPYIAHNVQVMEDYVQVYSGTLVILKTNKLYYEATVISGTFDFFSFLGKKTFADIDISEIVHAKTPQNVANAITNTSRPYAYFVGNFSNEDNYNNGLNVDAMPVAVKLQYLMDKIFEHAQMDYILPSSANIVEQFMTFPYPPYLEVGASGGNVFTLTKDPQTYFLSNPNLNSQEMRDQYAVWSSQSGLGFTTIGFDIVAVGGGQTLFDFEECIVEIQSLGIGTFLSTVECALIDTSINYEFARFTTDSIAGFDNNSTYRTVYNVSAGARIRVEFRYRNPNTSLPKVVRFESIILNLSGLDMSTDGLQRVFGFSLADFIKEMMYRYTLIPFQEGRTVRFVALNDILQSEGITDFVDWSDKYIERTDEVYDIGYAQNNYLTHRYAFTGDKTYDRNLESDNRTLPAASNIIESKVFAVPLQNVDVVPDQNNPTTIVSSRQWLTYDVTINNGNVSIKTENRNYFVRIIQESGPMQIRLESPSLPGDTVVQAASYNVGQYPAGFIENPRWNALFLLLDNTRMHSITLHLTQEDIRTLDQTKPIFFDQEQAYYVLNKLQYKKGEKAKGEFIKINY